MIKLDKENIEDILALTPMQEGMLFHYLKNPQKDYYFEQLTLDLSGEIDLDIFEKAWHVVIEANEMLRAVFRWEKVEKPVQIIVKEHKFQPGYYDFSKKEDNEKKKRVEQIKVEEKKNKFDLREFPFRVVLCKIEEDKYEMIVSNHHILYDGWSSGIILREFFNAYNGLINLHPLVKTVKTKFKEFIKWIQKQDTKQQEAFWREYLKDFDTNRGLSFKRKERGEIKSKVSREFAFPFELKNSLEDFVKKHKISLASLLYCAWGILLQRYNSSNDVLFDTTVSGRTAKIKRIEDIVGLFINTLPLRVRTHPGEEISRLLSRTDSDLQQRREFENSSLLPINEYLHQWYRENLFDSLVVIENYPLDLNRILRQEKSPSSIRVKSFSFSGSTYYDLTVIITPFEEYKINITYNKELFDEESLSGLYNHFTAVIHDMLTDLGKKVEETAVMVMNEEERNRLLAALRGAAENDEYREREYTAPRDQCERRLVEIWATLLQVDKDEIGIDSDFFNYGGHSLKASMLAGRINKEFKVKVPLTEIFKGHTIRQLARYIKEAAREKFTSVEIAEEKKYYPLSPAQQRMYTLQQMEPQSIAYNVSAAIMVERHLEEKHIKAFERAFQKLITRHQSLRTSFGLVNGEPMQIIHKHKEVDFHITYMDIEADYQQDASAADGVIQRFIKPFDLDRQPLIRIGLVRLAEAKHLLLFDTHHIIVDGTSMNIFIKEFIAFYSGEELPPVPIQYKDFSQWQRKRSKTEKVKKQEEYWLNIFSGEIPVLNLPTDFPRSSGRTGRFEGDTLNFTVSREIRQMLFHLEKESGATLYMILLAAYYLLLMKYSGQEDIVVGTLTDGRSHVDLENIIGVLITTLAMRNYPNREKRFFDFLQEVKNNSLNAFENSEYQFEELLKNIRFNREPERNPLFDTMFLLQNFEWTELSLEGLVFKTHPFKTNASTFDLRVTAVEMEEQLDIEIQYATRLFEKTSIERLAAHYINVLKELGTDYQKRLGEINILKGEEKQQILHEFNKAERDTGTRKTVYQMFEEQVEKSPGSCAVQVAGETLQYRELNEKSNRLARVLRKKGVQKGHSVGILLPPSPLVVESIFATWKAGGTYIPIDPLYPPQRIAGILKDSNAGVFLSQTGSSLPEIAGAFEGKIIELDQWEDEMLSESCANLELASDIDSLAYIIYTSGSTGTPKGVGVYHRGFFNLMTWFVMEFGLNANDSNLLVTSLSFDLTQKNIFAPLITGGTLTFPGSSYFEPDLFLEEIEERGITWLNCTPGMIYKIIEFSEAHDIKKLASLRYLFLGGEPIYMKMLRKWVESENFNAEIVNTYGPTECTDVCAYFRVIPPWSFFEKTVPFGKPIYNVRLYVLDTSFQPLPVGVPGELWIQGEGIGIGYINDGRLTSERFIENPLFPPPHGHSPTANLLYRTGDLVKWLPDGNIEFINRMDFQVKVRGFRIELGEIENQLLNHDKVQSAVVLALAREPLGAEETASDADVDVGKYLCAYFVSGESLGVPELKSHLSKQLPDYMIPSYFMQVAKIPLNPHGKIDRKLLPKPGIKIEGTGIGRGDRYVEAGSEIERKLVKIWQETLNMQAIGTNHNFFQLGGDSLLVIQVTARIREIFKVELPVRTFFQQPFIVELAKEIEARGRDVVYIPKAPEDAQIPLSFAQEQVWFLHQLNDSNVSYHVPRVIRIQGKLDIALMERTFNEIMRRHEILRTTFLTINSEPVQRIMEHHLFKLSIIDLTGLAESHQSQTVIQWLNEEGQRSFDFEKGPMIRITLLKLKPEEHLLVNTEHHLVHDGWTQGVLLREFIAIFTAFSQGGSSPLPELPIQYKDFAYWQREYMQGEVLENHLQYWGEKLSGLAPVLNLPTDRPRPPVISGQGAEKRLFLSKPLTHALKEFSRKKEVTLFMTMLAVYKVLLYRYVGVGDICVGTGAANRQYKEMEGMLGMVINTLALRTQLSGELSFEDCLQQVKTTCLEAFEHQDTPFEKIVERLQPERSLSYSPIFQVAFSFMDTPAERLQLPGLELKVEPAHNRSSKFDINVIVEPPSQERMEETGGRIEIVWEYNTDIFDDGTMDRMLRHYTRLLEAIFASPGKPLSTLPMLSDSEIHQLLYTFNETVSEYPKDKTIHQLFEEQVERTPNHIAVVGVVGQHLTYMTYRTYMTYKELNKKSNQLAHELTEKGVKPGDIVGIMKDRSIEMIVGILGILKAGGAYLPIDPGYPEERIRYMMADSASKILLTGPDYIPGGAGKQGGLAPLSVAPLYLPLEDNSAAHNPQLAPRNSHPATSPENIAYIIYTSGTTGKPKGVMIEHCSLVNRLNWMQKKYPIDKRDTILQKTPFTFDVSVWEILWWAITGAKVCLLPPGEEKDPEMITDAVETNNVTVIHFVPSMLTLFLEYLKEKGDAERLACLKQVISSGEALTLSQVKQFNEILYKKNSTKLANLYGPTEATIDVSYYNCFEEDDPEIVPIGKPIDNIHLYVLYKHLHLQPVGVAGELVIAGDGLARGYLNNPELTAEKFDQDFQDYQDYQDEKIKQKKTGKYSFTSLPLYLSTSLYRTGDLARWLPDGNIEFLGRIDHQVKIRGFRIELGEIESRLLDHNEIDEAVVISKEGRDGDRYLCAYIVARSMEHGAWKESAAELREYLMMELPDYMVPSYFVQLEKMPLTSNGKVERKALPEPVAVGKEKAYVAPRDAIEMSLVEIWAEVLGVEKDVIGIDSRFFELGGHSLKAFRLVSMIHKELEVKIPLATFFKMPFIRKLSRYIKGAAKDLYVSIIEAEKREYYPLSNAQKRLYISQHLELKSVGYNIQKVAQLEGRLSRHRLEETLRKLIERHESLRTSFEVIEDEPVQKIHRDVEFNIEYYTMEHGARSKEGLEVEQIIEDFIKPFDLSLPPLLRVGLIETGEEKYILMLNMHHIISDAISMNIIFNEFTSLYRGDPLPALRLHYKDLSLWQNKNNRNTVEREALKQQEAYWLRELEGEIPLLDLPVDYARPAIQAFEGAIFPFELDREKRGLLMKIALEEDATLFMVLVSLINILLSKICDQEDILLGIPVAGRRHPDLEPVIGFFVNMLVLRNHPSGGKTFREFLREVKEKTLRAYENQDYPFEDLVDKLSHSRDSSRHSLFDVAFTWENMENQGGYKYNYDEGISVGDLQLKPCYNEITIAPFDIVFWGGDSGEKLYFLINFRTSLFKKETIKTIVRNFNEVLSEVLKNQDIKLEDIASSHDLLLAAYHSSLEDQGDFGWD